MSRVDALEKKLEALTTTTEREYSGKVVVNGDIDTCYPILFTLGSATNTRVVQTLKIFRHYTDQSPDDWTTTSHRPSVYLEVDAHNSHWGGIDDLLHVKRHVWSYHQSICKVELAQPRRDGVIVWVVGGGDGGISFGVEATFEWKGVKNSNFGEGVQNAVPMYEKAFTYYKSEEYQYNRFVEPVNWAELKAAGGMLDETLCSTC
jgi:hypothetical protein